MAARPSLDDKGARMNADTLLKPCTAAVAAYAAIVSTAALGWNIYDAVRKNSGRLKVEENIAFGFSVSMLEGARNTATSGRIRPHVE